MKKNTIIIIVMAVLVLISAVQAMQLNSLKSTVKSEDFTIGESGQRIVTRSTTASSTPKSLENLPAMVGGC